MIRDHSINDGIELGPRFHSRSKDHSRTYRFIGKRRHGSSSTLTPEEQLDGACTIHCFEDDEGRLRASHTLRNCRLFTEIANRLKEEKERRAKRTRSAPPAPNTEERYPPSHGWVCMIQEGRPSKQKQEARTLQAQAAEDILAKEPYYLCDSKVSITFSQKDHPPAIPRPGHAPLVLEAQI